MRIEVPLLVGAVAGLLGCTEAARVVPAAEDEQVAGRSARSVRQSVDAMGCTDRVFGKDESCDECIETDARTSPDGHSTRMFQKPISGASRAASVMAAS